MIGASKAFNIAWILVLLVLCIFLNNSKNKQEIRLLSEVDQIYLIINLKTYNKEGINYSFSPGKGDLKANEGGDGK